MNEIIQQEQQQTNAPLPSVIDNLNRAYNLASFLCQASNIPQAYQNRPADCMIAIDMAERMNVSPMFVFQNMFVVKGKPSWSGQACKALIDNCGKFRNAKHVYFGEGDNHGCYIEAIRTDSNEVVRGVAVTVAMAKAENWWQNKKWQNMTDLMLGYRAATFFARIHCPELLMGLATEGEADDIKPSTNASNLTNSLKGVNSDAE